MYRVARGVVSSGVITLRRVCVFCGSSFGNNPYHRAAAEQFATLLAQNGIGIVYGGARNGLMGAVADAALVAGGEVVGVLPRSMAAREIAHSGITALHLVDTLHERKALMAELSDAFVALPGGVGTFEEIFEAWSWAQIGLHQKPCALLNTDGFYSGLLAFLQSTVDAGFVRAESRALLRTESEPDALLCALQSYAPTPYDRWNAR